MDFMLRLSPHKREWISSSW